MVRWWGMRQKRPICGHPVRAYGSPKPSVRSGSPPCPNEGAELALFGRAAFRPWTVQSSQCVGRNRPLLIHRLPRIVRSRHRDRKNIVNQNLVECARLFEGRRVRRGFEHDEALCWCLELSEICKSQIGISVSIVTAN